VVSPDYIAQNLKILSATSDEKRILYENILPSIFLLRILAEYHLTGRDRSFIAALCENNLPLLILKTG